MSARAHTSVIGIAGIWTGEGHLDFTPLRCWLSFHSHCPQSLE
jgi:hypothetical protein